MDLLLKCQLIMIHSLLYIIPSIIHNCFMDSEHKTTMEWLINIDLPFQVAHLFFHGVRTCQSGKANLWGYWYVRLIINSLTVDSLPVGTKNNPFCCQISKKNKKKLSTNQPHPQCKTVCCHDILLFRSIVDQLCCEISLSLKCSLWGSKSIFSKNYLLSCMKLPYQIDISIMQIFSANKKHLFEEDHWKQK